MTENLSESSGTRGDVRRSALSRSLVILLVVVGCILLAVANVSFWASRDLFDAQRFGQLVAEGLQTEEASTVLAGAIVEFILEEVPKIPKLVRAPAEEMVATVLQRPVMTTVLAKVAAAANVAVTTNANDAVQLDLERVVPSIVGAAVAVDPALADTVAAARESTVLTLLGPGELPNLRWFAQVAPWLWPLALVGTIGLFLAALRWTEDRRAATTWIGLGVVITVLIELLFIPSLRVAVQNNVTNPHVRVIVGEVVTALTRGFWIQGLLLVIIGLIALVAGRYFFKAGDDDSADDLGATNLEQYTYQTSDS